MSNTVDILSAMSLSTADQRYLQAVTGRADGSAGDDAFLRPLQAVAALATEHGSALDWRMSLRMGEDLHEPRRYSVDAPPGATLHALERCLQTLPPCAEVTNLLQRQRAEGELAPRWRIGAAWSMWPTERLQPLQSVVDAGVMTGLVVGTGRTRSRHLALEHAPARGEGS